MAVAASEQTTYKDVALAIYDDLMSEEPAYPYAPDDTGAYARELAQLLDTRKKHGRDAAERVLETIKANKKSVFAALLKERETTHEQSFQFLEFKDLRELPRPQWLIYEVLPTKGVNFLYGKPGCGKTFVSVGMACSVAFDLANSSEVISALDREFYRDALNWCGRVTRHGHVVYIAAEDIDEVAQRALAWADYHQVNDLPNLHFFPCPLNLAKDTPRFIEAIKARYADVKIALIIVDTLAMCSIGAEENSKKEFDAVIHSLEMLWRTYTCCVVAVHHAGKNGEMRGTSSMDGVAYSVIEVSEVDENIMLRSVKMRRGKKFGEIYLNRQVVETGDQDETGQPATTCVIVKSDRQTEEAATQLTKFQDSILECIKTLGGTNVPRTELVNACDINQKRMRTFSNAVNALNRKGLISMKKEKQRTFYTVQETGEGLEQVP